MSASDVTCAKTNYKEYKKKLSELTKSKKCSINKDYEDAIKLLEKTNNVERYFNNIDIMKAIGCVIDNSIIEPSSKDKDGDLKINVNVVNVLGNTDMVAVRSAISKGKDKEKHKADKQKLVNHDVIAIEYLNNLRPFTPCFQYIFTNYRCDNGLSSKKIGNTGIVCSGEHNLYSFEENTNSYLNYEQTVKEMQKTNDVFNKSQLKNLNDHVDQIIFMILYSLYLSNTFYLNDKHQITNFNLDENKIAIRKLDKPYDLPIAVGDKNYIIKITYIPIIKEFDSCCDTIVKDFNMEKFRKDIESCKKISTINSIKLVPKSIKILGEFNEQTINEPFTVENYNVKHLHESVNKFLNKLNGTKLNNILNKLVETFPNLFMEIPFNDLIKDLQMKILKEKMPIFVDKVEKYEEVTRKMYEESQSNKFTSNERINYGNIINNIDTYLDQTPHNPVSILNLFFEGKYDDPQTIHELLSQLIYISEKRLQQDRFNLTDDQIRKMLPGLIKRFEELYIHVNNDLHEDVKLLFYFCVLLILKINKTAKLSLPLFNTYGLRLMKMISTSKHCFGRDEICSEFASEVEKQVNLM
jgi:hypothetical protein